MFANAIWLHRLKTNTMKKQSINPGAQVLKNTFLFLLLVVSLLSKAAGHEGAKKTVGVFINDKRIQITRDSVAINNKGTLTLRGLVNESPRAEPLRFRVLIRHRNFAGNILMFRWDEKYKDGEPFNAVDLSKILPKMKVGDQLIVIPIESDSSFENSGEQFQITVTGDNC